MPLRHLSKWYALLTVYVSMIALAVMSVVYSNRVSTRTSQQFCDIVTTLDNAYRSQPPQTAIGQKLARDMHELRHTLHCR
jgi:hypothetical protein